MMDAWRWPPLSTVLENLNRAYPVTATSTDGRGEWVLLKSEMFPDRFLFDRLKLDWPQFVPYAESRRFALIFCRTGPNSGVWLHYFATPTLRTDYLPGCHEIVSWV
jgi:hypothetical protein